MITKEKAMEAAQNIVDFCKQQNGCQNCILRDYYDEFDGSDAEFDQFIENELVKYDPYWTPCIILYVDN